MKMVFNEELGSNAIRWVGEDGGSKKRDNRISQSAQRHQCDPVVNLTKKGRGFRLPSPAKFGTGYVPSCGFASVSQTDSDTEICSSGSEDGINGGGMYSVIESFKDDDKFMHLKEGKGVEKLKRNGDSKQVKSPDFVNDELLDSATSTEVSFTQLGIQNSGFSQRATTHTSDGYSSGVTSWENQEILGRELRQKKQHYINTPSAPPLVVLGSEINSTADQSSSSLKAHNKPKFGNLNDSVSTNGLSEAEAIHSGATVIYNIEISKPSYRTAAAADKGSPVSLPARLPAFRLVSEPGTWCSVIAYDACVRLCLHKWAMQSSPEVHCFLENECAVLRDAFGLRHVLLQSEDELLQKRSAELVSQGAAKKSKKNVGKIKVQVRRVNIGLVQSSGCFLLPLPSMKALSFAWGPVTKVRLPRVPANGSFSARSSAFAKASTKYVKEISGRLKSGVTNVRSGSLSYEVVQETYSCSLRLKGSSEEDAVRMQPGSGEEHVFFPDSLGDYLMIEVQDSKAQYHGRAIVQVAAIADNPGDKLRWYPVYVDAENEPVGRIQLQINYSISQNDTNHPKCGSVAETMAYDFVVEVAMKAEKFQQRNLSLHGPWKWLVTEFASYYGVSNAYTKLRYLSYIMDVATPTADCLNIVYDLLSDVLSKVNCKSMLSHQENRMLADIKEQVKDLLALTFENYKSLDESLPSGVMDVFRPASKLAAPALAPAINLFTLLHDISSPEARLKFCRYFQVAAKKRLCRHLAETDDFTLGSNEVKLTDVSMYYEKMKSLILNIRNEIFTDKEIHNQKVLPSFMEIELPNLSSSIYSVELCARLHAFLIACPPPGPTPPVVQLVITAADFQRDLASWDVKPVNGGVDAKELFNVYISQWIQDKRLHLLELCKVEKVKWSGVRPQRSTTPFVDDMYDHLKETLNEYEVIMCRWPGYVSVLENAIADVEKAAVEALDKQYADVLLPLKDNLTNKLFGHKYIQKLSNGTVNAYFVPDELGILLNSMKRLLDVLWPKIDTQLKSWSSCIPDDGHAVKGEYLNDVTVTLRTNFRIYKKAIVQKLAENTRAQNTTKLKGIIRDSKEVESDLQNRMQPLKDLLVKTIDHLHTVVESPVFIEICRELWDRMGQDILQLLVDRKEKRTWYKGSRVAVSILDNIFASEMQKLLGNSLQVKDLDPPESIKEIHSMLCKV
ncbi:uncharacterized protein LOC107425129 isoform X3 [Ziziphus jujuba]|uniref:Uncharacterized protein LOC107425129 isoform X3 n=1 Tax=Ziziphus jujuba TaxID=326968 RepID=A0ABM4AEP0_ZIZJJ|nr:uncharacterized protein LOC107425129 isoform X3 [Ziziphus jujuba]